MSELNPASDTKAHSETQRYLEFSLGKEEYAIPLLKVREVIAVPNTTPIPHTPEYFKGIMNLRGQVISVIDIREKLKIQPKEENQDTAVIIVDLSPIFLGVIVDSVNKVLAIAPEDFSAPPAIDGEKVDYLQGVYRNEDKMTILMDIGKALNVEDLKVAEAQTQNPAA